MQDDYRRKNNVRIAGEGERSWKSLNSRTGVPEYPLRLFFLAKFPLRTACRQEPKKGLHLPT